MQSDYFCSFGCGSLWLLHITTVHTKLQLLPVNCSRETCECQSQTLGLGYIILLNAVVVFSEENSEHEECEE